MSEHLEEREEQSLRPAIRDIVAGALLLVIGLLTGGSWLWSLLTTGELMAEGVDGLDVAFDALGLIWLGWGLARLVRYWRARR